MARSPANPSFRLPPTWRLFFIFLLANSLLSYLPLPPGAQGGVLLLGLLLPCAWALRQNSGTDSLEGLLRKDFLPAPPAWAWVLLAAAAVFLRFYRLTTLSVWPNYDDGLWGFFALRFMHQWDWSFFYQDNSYPSTYAWGLALLFKLFNPSVFMVWFYPALLSLLVAPLGYAAVRRVFPRSLSLGVALFLALGFWPLFVGRFGNQQVLTLLWECLWLWALGGFWRSLEKKQVSWREPVVLGLVTALGFYIYISWVAVAFFTLVTVAALAWGKTRPGFKAALGFLGTFALGLAPILAAGLFHNYGRIVHDIGSLQSSVTLSGRGETAWGYLSCLFWSMPPGRFSYQPVWGGLLNPLAGALFFLGLLEILRDWRKPFCLWLMAGLFLFFLPGTLTHDVEPFRNLPLIPLLALVWALGLGRLLEPLPLGKRAPLLLALVLVFAGLDFYHLAVRYHGIWDQAAVWKGYAKPMERFRAFQVLDQIQREKGPGLVYSNFTPGLCDQTLSVADHAFNAAENPDLSWKDARWAALLVNAGYKPFLSRRFPGGKAYYLSGGLDASDGGEMLWVLPVTPRDGETFRRWQAANDAYVNFPGRYYGILRDNLVQAHPAFQTDPFLESCYWEKLADLDFRVSLFKDPEKPIGDLEQGVKKGYGAAHLYYKLAVFHLLLGEKDRARACLLKARSAPLDLTASQALLKSIPAGR